MLPKEFINIGKPRLVQPKAEDIELEFERFMELCKVKKLPSLKMLWTSYLGVTRQTYHYWKEDKRNQYLNKEEFEARVNVMKKIDEVLETSLGVEIMTDDKPTGAIFTAKAQYNWSDRGNGESDNNVKFTGYLMPVTAPKKEVKPEE